MAEREHQRDHQHEQEQDREHEQQRDRERDRGHQSHSQPQPQPAKDPDEWVTGEEPMTGPQASYLSTLAHEAGEDVDEDMTKAEASKKIDELQDRTGRGAT